MTKIICSPGSYVQGPGELEKLGQYAQPFGPGGAYIIAGHFVNTHYHDQLTHSFSEKNLPCVISEFGGECSMEEITKHKDNLGDASVVIGIGGGKVLDTAKAVAHYAGLPVIIAPTIASTDAPCSRLSVIYKENGEFESYLPLPKNPEMVLMDTNIICAAPARFMIAGIGDALATYYEAAACVASNATTMAGGHVTNAAFALAKLCRDILLEDGLKAVAAAEQSLRTKAVENIIEANTYLSGGGFESSGLAAAHAIHNGLTILPECHDKLHGEKVAFGTLTQLVLENYSLEELGDIITFCKAIGLPTTFKDLGIEGVSDEQLMEVAKRACAPDDTMGNMPFSVTPEDVFSAMKTADALGQAF